MCCVLPYHGDEGREADDGEADEDPNEKGAKKSCDSPHKEVVAFHPIDFDASTKEHPKVAESQKHFTKGKYDFHFDKPPLPNLLQRGVEISDLLQPAAGEFIGFIESLSLLNGIENDADVVQPLDIQDAGVKPDVLPIVGKAIIGEFSIHSPGQTFDLTLDGVDIGIENILKGLGKLQVLDSGIIPLRSTIKLEHLHEKSFDFL